MGKIKFRKQSSRKVKSLSKSRLLSKSYFLSKKRSNRAKNKLRNENFFSQLGNFPTVSKLSLCRVKLFPFWSWERRACADWFELVSSSRFQPVFTLSLSCALVLREWEGEKTHFFSIFFFLGNFPRFTLTSRYIFFTHSH